MLKFAEVQNILDVLMKYEILGFCRLGNQTFELIFELN